MAIKPCRECGSDVSAEAKSCPRCGVLGPVAPDPEVQRRVTLQLAAVVIAGILLVALCARTGTDGGPTVVAGGGESTWEGPPFLDLNAIAGRSPEEIDEAFGPPDSVTTEQVEIDGPAYPVHYYGDGMFEVFFVDGRGEWITVWGRGELPYSRQALPALGLEPVPPTWDGGSLGMRWENIPSLLELNLFPAAGDTAVAGTAWYAVIDVEHPL